MNRAQLIGELIPFGNGRLLPLLLGVLPDQTTLGFAAPPVGHRLLVLLLLGLLVVDRQQALLLRIEGKRCQGRGKGLLLNGLETLLGFAVALHQRRQALAVPAALNQGLALRLCVLLRRLLLLAS